MWIRTVFLIGLTFVFSHGAAAAEAPAKNSQKDALAEQKQIIESQKGVVEAQRQLVEEQKKLIDAMFPSIADKGKSGSITQGDKPVSPPQAQFNAYRAVHAAAKEICKALAEASPVVIYSDADLAAVLRYQWVAGAIERLTKELQQLTPRKALEGAPPEAGLPPTLYPYFAASALSMIADFGRLFRTDKKIIAESPAIEVQDVVRSVAACAPSSSMVTTSESVARVAFNIRASEIVKKIESLEEARNAAVKAVRESQIAKQIISDAGKARNDAKAKQAADAAKSRVLDEDRVTNIEQTNQRAGKLLASILETDDASKPPVLAQLLVGEVLATGGKAAIRRVVVHKVSGSGSSLLSQSIWRSDRLYSSGGVTLAYSISDDKGRLLSSGTLACETPYVEVEQIRGLGNDSTSELNSAPVSCK